MMPLPGLLLVALVAESHSKGCIAGLGAWPLLLTALMTICVPLLWQMGKHCLALW